MCQQVCRIPRELPHPSIVSTPPMWTSWNLSVQSQERLAEEEEQEEQGQGVEGEEEEEEEEKEE